MRSRDDDDVILWADELPPLLPDGEYDFVCRSVTRVQRFKSRWVVDFEFIIVTLGPYFRAVLPGYCPLGATRTARIGPRSKLASWLRAIAAFSGEHPSRVPLSAFRRYWFRGKVAKTTTDHQQRPRHPRDQYSTVTDLVSVVGKLSELPPAQQCFNEAT
jgi:hypothetical protein